MTEEFEKCKVGKYGHRRRVICCWFGWSGGVANGEQSMDVRTVFSNAPPAGFSKCLWLSRTQRQIPKPEVGRCFRLKSEARKPNAGRKPKITSSDGELLCATTIHIFKPRSQRGFRFRQFGFHNSALIVFMARLLGRVAANEYSGCNRAWPAFQIKTARCSNTPPGKATKRAGGSITTRLLALKLLPAAYSLGFAKPGPVGFAGSQCLIIGCI